MKRIVKKELNSSQFLVFSRGCQFEPNVFKLEEFVVDFVRITNKAKLNDIEF